MFAQHSRAARLQTSRNEIGQPVVADEKLTHALHESTTGRDSGRAGQPLHCMLIGQQTESTRASIASFVPIPVTSQGPTVKEATRSQGLTSRDATSIQGPTLKGRAAANWTKREQAASSSCKHCQPPGTSLPGQRAALGRDSSRTGRPLHRRQAKLHRCRRSVDYFFYRPVDRSRSISTVDKDSPT